MTVPGLTMTRADRQSNQMRESQTQKIRSRRRRRGRLVARASTPSWLLSDPIDRFLPADQSWRGVAGEYVVTLGGSSGAQPGTDDALPILTASVNAFSRMWLGVRPATALNFTDDLSGPPELLEALDSLLRLPDPQPDWDF